ncbi:acylphosphatase [Actinomadura roseirufa]|uniref:acylphosphatase n=1 Tax=Actinomadura roseirufa TaxID=2094049 RepID=UPI0010418F4D|nr:acylphosphatase [Actinomadura roseirufa]
MDGDDDETVRLTAWVRGRVQGVGFRWWVRARALELGLAGSATNLRDGRVEVVAEGPRGGCRRLLELLAGGGGAEAGSGAGAEAAPAAGGEASPLVRPPARPGSVSGVTERWSEPRGEAAGFRER